MRTHSFLRSPSAMWNTGDRVLAKRPPEDFLYPAVIRHIQDDRYFVIFDDGEDGFVQAQQMQPFQLEIGDPVDALHGRDPRFQQGKVHDKKDDAVQVAFPDGGLAWIAYDKLRIPSKRARPARAPRDLNAVDWQVGDRIWACWFDLCWYPGVVLHAEDGQVTVLFDHGATSSMTADRIRKLSFQERDRIECRWRGGNEYFPGEIVRRHGEVINVHFDDGDEETTLIRLTRLQKDDWLPDAPPQPLGAGDRVLGRWFDDFWYPGILLDINGKRLHVLFDDNDQAHLTWDRVRPVDVDVGDQVFCRFKGGPAYFPGEIAERRGERIFVRYDDGREEWTSVRLVRVER